MLAEARPVAGRAHLFECPARQADIMGGLVGVQKRAALLRIGGPGDLVVHLRRSPVAMQTATANVAARQARMGAMGRVRGRSKMSPPRFRAGLAEHPEEQSVGKEGG